MISIGPHLRVKCVPRAAMLTICLYSIHFTRSCNLTISTIYTVGPEKTCLHTTGHKKEEMYLNLLYLLFLNII